MTDSTNATDLDLDRVESLDELADLANASENPQPSPGEQKAAAAAELDTSIRDWFNTFRMVRGAGLFIGTKTKKLTDQEAHQLATIWGDPQLQGIAEPAAEICRRHGWDLETVTNAIGPYVALAVALGMPAMETLDVIQSRKARLNPVTPAANDGQQQQA